LDTEFISEDTYRPQLCLVQVATDDTLAVIDPLAVEDLRPFWHLLADPTRATIVHAGREEVSFCLTAIERSPHRLFDTQIAAALVGADYPAGYAALVTRFLGQRPGKGETRTDWRRRPLSEAQIQYALEDVRYLLPLRDRLYDALQSRGRVAWMRTETDVWHDALVAARSRRRWRRVSGISGLSPRSMAIVRELWIWRDDEARKRNVPARRVLRDDLIIEIAKRRSADIKKIRSVRGLNRPPLAQRIPQLAACVERALQLDDDVLPQRARRDTPPQLNLIAQFLTSALSSICRQAEVAPSIVGTASDVRELIAYRLGYGPNDPEQLPVLAQGWRTDVVGSKIDDLLAGKLSIRIVDPTSNQPLVFEPNGAPMREVPPPHGNELHGTGLR